MKTVVVYSALLLGLILSSSCMLLSPLFVDGTQTTTTNVDQNKDEGYIRFSNITSQHEIFLDGTGIGTGGAYQAGGQLGVMPGTHEIEIREAGLVRLKQKVFIGTGSTRTIDIR